MAVTLIPRTSLTAAQIATVRARLSAPEHAADWYELKVPDTWERMRAYAYIDDLTLIGVITITGSDDAIDPAWWIDKLYRGQGYGRRMIEALAPLLIAQGVTGIKRNVMIASGPSDPASRKLVNLLRELVGQFTASLSS